MIIRNIELSIAEISLTGNGSLGMNKFLYMLSEKTLKQMSHATSHQYLLSHLRRYVFHSREKCPWYVKKYNFALFLVVDTAFEAVVL
jgi:hypothetical protein